MSDIKAELTGYADLCRHHEDYQVMDLIERSVFEIQRLEALLKGRDEQLAKFNDCVSVPLSDMQTIKDCVYVVKDCLDDHMTADAQCNILYIVRIADKFLKAAEDKC